MSLKIATVVGARPQFIKCAPVSRVLRAHAVEVLVHTGQHYDDNMSAAFFRDLHIPEPEYTLGVGSGSHAVQTARMLARLEEVFVAEGPDRVLTYGDTNSTLAGALAATKLGIPVTHVEAGLRSFNRAMPEELNRILADRIADQLFCPTQTSVQNLDREGIRQGVHLVGDVMLDALRHNVELASARATIEDRLGLVPGEFAVATVHRAENTDVESRLEGIVAALSELAKDIQVIWPMHPRTTARLQALSPLRERLGQMRLIAPAAYLDMLWLTANAKLVLTDSGGLQKEAAWLGTPCLTLRDETEWSETVQLGYNQLVGADRDRILESARAALHRAPLAPMDHDAPNAATAIAEIMTSRH